MSNGLRRLLIACLVVAAALWLGSRGDDGAAPAEGLGGAQPSAVAAHTATGR